jgi:putative transposase
MTNHTHLLVTPEEKMSLPQMMQAMGREYVQPTNKIQGRTGTLWEGRYKASPVQDDEYLLTCYRYIELNPVRAGIAVSPGAYEYSSYRSNALGIHNPLISPHPTYFELGRNRKGRCRAYRGLFHDRFSDNELCRIRSSTNACRIIGDQHFLSRMESKIGHPLRPGKVGRPRSRKKNS